MATTETTQPTVASGIALGRVSRRALAARNQRPRLHSAELHAVRRGRNVPGAGHRSDEEDLGAADDAVRRGAEERRPRRFADPEFDHGSWTRLHRPGQRDHCRPADRGATQARHHAERRAPHGPECPGGVQLHPGSPRGRSVHEVSEDAQRRRVRRVYRRHPQVPQFARADGPAGRLRPRPDHRRLPACGPVRGGPPD